MSGSTGSAGFAYTFTFVRQTISTSESAMSLFTEDIEVVMEDIDQQVLVVVVPQQDQVPMSIDEPQEVDPEVLRETSASISIVDMEMEEAWEHVPAPSSAAMPIDDVLDDVPMVPAYKKDLVSRFFARMASTKAIRSAVLPRQMVIEADDSELVKAEPVTPRPKSPAGRAQGKVNQRSIHDEVCSAPTAAVAG